MGNRPNNQSYVADRLAKVMFTLSLIFLALIAALIVLWVDIPRVELLAAEAGEANVSEEVLQEASYLERNVTGIGEYFFFALLTIWPLFWAEFIYNIATSQKSIGQYLSTRKFELFMCLCPPLRLAAPNRQMDGMIWLPSLGWQQPGKNLKRRLEHLFGTPMLVIALLILPILLIEFGLKSVVESNFPLQLTLHICTGLIWCAFAIEFIVMINATDKKLAYVKKNWIDLAIILLPLISFLRSLRAIRAFKVAKFAKVQQLARVGRIYRMRGLMAKALRALMLFEFINRLMRITPEKRLSKLLEEKQELMEELEELEQKIQNTRQDIQREIQSRDLKRQEAGANENATDDTASIDHQQTISQQPSNQKPQSDLPDAQNTPSATAKQPKSTNDDGKSGNVTDREVDPSAA